MKKEILLLFSWLCLAVAVYAQQDPQYSQYMFNQVGINPAYAGTKDVLSANLFYRDQWNGFPGAPTTEVFNMHSPLRGNRVSLGLQVIGDQIGPVSTTSFLSTYAYKMHVGKGHLSFGLSAGLMDRVIDYSKIEYKDQSDPYASSSLGKVGKMIPTFDFGVYYYTKSFYVGYSITHLNQPAYGSIKDSVTGTVSAVLKAHQFITLGKAWVLNDNLVFRPSLLIKYVAGAPASIDLDASFLIKNTLWMGITLRTSGAIVGIIQYTISERMKIGYAYDLTISDLSAYGRSSHELFLGYDFNIFKTKTLSPRYF
jgi:type IX secretion system PorP/SprF family membrane protein